MSARTVVTSLTLKVNTHLLFLSSCNVYFVLSPLILSTCVHYSLLGARDDLIHPGFSWGQMHVLREIASFFVFLWRKRSPKSYPQEQCQLPCFPPKISAHFFDMFCRSLQNAWIWPKQSSNYPAPNPEYFLQWYHLFPLCAFSTLRPTLHQFHVCWISCGYTFSTSVLLYEFLMGWVCV